MIFYDRVYFVFFFFKQKTAYEMRISDWSSDVCSSDLSAVFWSTAGYGPLAMARNCPTGRRRSISARPTGCRAISIGVSNICSPLKTRPCMIRCWTRRSEEHTSELQSLMRISYDVFCLKKKKQRIKTTRKKQPHT